MTQKSALYSTIPFVGLHKIMELEVLECVNLYRATLGPLVYVDKGWIWGSP